MKTKLLLLSTILIISATTANSQKTRIGLTAGATFSSYHFKDNATSTTTDMNVGFTSGILVDAKICKSFSIQPAFNFLQLRSSVKDDLLGSTVKETLRVHYLDFPVNVLYNSSKGFFVGGGPSVSFALTGKAIVKASGVSQSEDLQFGKGTNDDLRSSVFSANVVTGYQLKNGFFIAANYNHSLSNLEPQTSNGKIRSSYFGIRLGYMFHQ